MAKTIALPTDAPPKQNPLPFKSMGGKAWLVRSRLLDVWTTRHRHRRLFDPFVGGGAFPFLLQPQKAFLSDYNRYLMYAYVWLRNGAKRTIQYEFNPESYYDLRTRFNERRDQKFPLYLGECYYLLHRSCHRGRWRVNQKGAMNTGWGHYKTFPTIDLEPYSRMLQNWDIYHLDYLSACAEHLHPDDFLVLDPPYQGTEDGYTDRRFDWDDQLALGAIAKHHPGPVVVCNAPDERLQEIYREAGLTVELVEGGQAIGNGKPGTRKRMEILAYKNL